jgi:nucleotide-binding universal stress UspA family protein
MRRVLVPLDGTGQAAAILPDARRLAGRNGELLLVHDTRLALADLEQYPGSASTKYLDAMADELRAHGALVQTHSLRLDNVAVAIDEAATIFKADMIAVATHGRKPAERLFWGSIAWSALAHSPVPVLLRHVEKADGPLGYVEPLVRHILVPLDGSTLAERVLPLARELAAEWRASVWLAQVATPTVTGFPDDPQFDPSYPVPSDVVLAARAYLERLVPSFEGRAQAKVLTGLTAETLVNAAGDWGITDVVMTSHGRTGLARVIFGSVADSLIHLLHCPIIVIPPLALVAAK